MSGRDLRSFVTSHRASEADSLVRRVSEGLLSSKYRAIDYEQLKQYTAEKKFKAHLSFAKVKKLEKASKQQKEQNLMKQHKRVWDHELIKLASHRRRATADLDLFIRQNTDGQLNKALFQDFENYESFLEDDFREFKKNTVDPVWSLRDDLLYWMHQNNADLKNPSENLQREHRMVRSQVEHVRTQQGNLLEQLRHEQISLENELRAGDLVEIINPSSERLVETGIPAEGFELECPDDGLKASVLQEFIFVDEKYTEKMEDLEDRYAQALVDVDQSRGVFYPTYLIDQSDTGGWAAEDHFAFLAIVEQYPFDIQNRRTLYMDRLLRHFPKKSRSEIVEHEDWWFLYKYYNERKKALVNDWLRDRHELYNRASVVFQEVCVALEMQAAKVEHQSKQQELCDALYAKVQVWREQKMEMMQLQQQLEETRRQEEMEQRQQQQEKEQARRQKEKEKVSAFREEQRAVQKAQAEEDQRRLEELQNLMAEQAVYDKQRVEFRDEQMAMKREERQRKLLEKQEQELEKERILEALREQVRPNVEGDLLRLWSDTEAWQQHTKKRRDDEEAYIQKPLFELNTFTSKQVTSDPRVRLEGRLREAGLLDTDYARHMISQMPPQQPPRRDMLSTVFKQ